MTYDIIVQLAPIGIAILALCISIFSLGWNVYRDVILKPRVKMKFTLCNIAHPSFPEPLTTLSLCATNFGPGSVKLNMIHLRLAPLWRRILRREQYWAMIHDYKNPLSAKLPAKVDVGESIDLLIPYEKDCLLKDDRTHIGLTDSFGRAHWASRADMKKAKREYDRDFATK